MARRSKVQELASASTTGGLTALWHRHGVFALAATRLVSLVPELADELTDELEVRIGINRRHALLNIEITRRVIGSLADGGVRAVPLKGPSLAERIHGDMGLRGSADVDVLVSKADLTPAVAALISAGYVPLEDIELEDRPLLHYALRPRTGSGPPVELHWRVHWYEAEYGNRMVERTPPSQDGVPRLAPPDELAALLLVYARDGLHGLRQPADIAAWWDRYGDRLAPGALGEILDAHPRLVRPLLASLHQVSSLMGVPGQELAGARHPDRRTQLACRLSSWTLAPDFDQLEADRVLIDYFLGPDGDGLRFVRRHVLAPRSQATSRAGRLLHPLKLLIRHALSLSRIRKARSATNVQ
jgi:hypothetical protein